MRRWLPEAESLMPALEVQFRVLKGNRGHVLQTRICSKPSRDPAPRFQYTIFSSISCAALRHGVFSVLPQFLQLLSFCLNTENRPLCCTLDFLLTDCAHIPLDFFRRLCCLLQNLLDFFFIVFDCSRNFLFCYPI